MWQDSLAIDGKGVTDKLKMPELKLDGPASPAPKSGGTPKSGSSDKGGFNPLLD